MCNYFKRSGTLIQELTFKIPCRYEFRRVHIYGCPECGDLGCGSVTMQLIEKADTVIWQRFDGGREEYANYMSSDKSDTNGQLFELWQKRDRDYSILDAFGLSKIEMDYEYCYELRSGKISLSPGADIRRGDEVTIDFPDIGHFEFDKIEYFKAFENLMEIKYFI